MEWEDSFVPDYDEMGIAHSDTTKVRGAAVQRKGNPCPLCPARFTHVRRHVLQEHLPWYAAPEMACWHCGHQEGQKSFTRKHLLQHHPEDTNGFGDGLVIKYLELMHGFLWAITKHLGMGTLDSLVTRAAEMCTSVPSSTELPLSEEVLMGRFCKEILQKKHTPSVNPLVCVCSLLHWCPLSSLFSQLSPGDQEALFNLEDYIDARGRHIV